MQTRTLSRTEKAVSIIGLGTWQLGADWGDVSEADALAVLDASVQAGVTLFDTADVYGDGRSETLIGEYLESNPELDVTVATKRTRRSRRNLRSRAGEAFDVGETFSGVDFDRGVAAAQEFGALIAAEPTVADYSSAQVALAWVSQLDGVSTVIPGARNVSQAAANALAGSVPQLSDGFSEGVREIYDRYFGAAIHERW